MSKSRGRPRDPNSSYLRRVTIPVGQVQLAREIQEFFGLPTIHDAYRYAFAFYSSQIFPKVKQQDFSTSRPVQTVVTSQPFKEVQQPLQPKEVPSAESSTSRKASLLGSLKNR